MELIEKIDRMISGISEWEATWWDTVTGYCSVHQDEILEKNREQMALGLKPDGTPIVPSTYAYIYEQYKRRKGLQYQFTDLRQTGAFYESLLLYTTDEEVTVTNDNQKWDVPVPASWIPHFSGDMSLHERYGEVLGIPDDYYEEVVIPDVREAVSERLRECMGLEIG